MTQTINIGWLLPMWASRERTDEEWDFWISNLERKSRLTPDPRTYIMKKQLDFMLVYNSCSQIEKTYVVKKLSDLLGDLKFEELNKTGKVEEYIREIEELINDDTPCSGYTEKEMLEVRDEFLLEELSRIEKLDAGKREYVKENLNKMLKSVRVLR